MHRRTITKLVIMDTIASYSPAIHLIDANGIEMAGELLELPRGAEVNVNVEWADDLENWRPFAGNMTMSSVGRHARAWSGIKARYVRFKLTVGLGYGTAVAMFSVATTKP